jgi:hypothetical protein
LAGNKRKIGGKQKKNWRETKEFVGKTGSDFKILKAFVFLKYTQ